jgi:tRNA(fMet)-specific endonuclease VapC
VAELLFGAYVAKWGDKRIVELREEMQKYVIVDFSSEMAEHWARIRAEGRAVGHELKSADAWIAATALELGCPVVTNNSRDFTGINGLQVITENV